MSQISVVKVTKALLFQLFSHSQKRSQSKKLKLYLNLQKILDQPQNLKLILILENQLLVIKITMKSWEKFQNRKPCLMMMKMNKSTLFLVQLVPKKNKLKIFSKINPPKLKEQDRKKRKEKERKQK